MISTYAPTMTNTDETKDKFYEDFEYVISAVPAEDKLIILSDFNARVGQGSASWEGVLGKHEPENTTAMANCFFRPVQNIIFLWPTPYSASLLAKKTSYMHPRSHHWHLIDYIIVRRRDWGGESHEGCVWCRMQDRSSPNPF